MENQRTRSVIPNLCINSEYSRVQNAPLVVSSSLFLAIGDDAHNRSMIFLFTFE